MNILGKYEPVIGLEVHARLLTQSKLFSSEPNSFGMEPNTNVSPVTLAHPGTLPFLNEQVIEKAILLGLACESTIASTMYFERKNYFYPDLPKGYQISQLKTPICTGGFVEILIDGAPKQIALNRIHIEEDAGKSIHDIDPNYSLIDLNRAGTPLVEIVSEPVLQSAEEAFQFLLELRKTVRYLDVCDGNMEEGSLRCDANISLRLKGTEKLGTKVEVKNLNSVRFLKKAIELEIERQARELESGNTIVQHTRSFDAEKGATFAMRFKEEADDYRYFPEPDLPLIKITNGQINDAKEKMPELPGRLRKKFTEHFGLSANDAATLTEEKTLALYFLELAETVKDGKTAANWMLGPVKSYLNAQQIAIEDFPVKTAQMAQLIELVKQGTVSHSAAATGVFDELAKHPNEAPASIAQRLNLVQQSDIGEIERYAQEVIGKFPEKVKEFRNGKKGLIGFFMGETMKLSKGNLDPQLTNKILTELLKK